MTSNETAFSASEATVYVNDLDIFFAYDVDIFIDFALREGKPEVL